MSRRGGDERPAPLRVAAPKLPALLGEHHSLGIDESVSNVRIVGLAGDVKAAGATADAVVIDGARLDTLEVSDGALTDVSIADLQATEVRASSARLRRTLIDGARIGVLDLSDSRVDAVEIRAARIDYLRLDGAHVRDLLVTRCTIGTLDMPDADVQRMSVRDSSVAEIDTRMLRAKDLDLRGSGMPSITDVAGLRGATLSEFQMRLLLPVFAEQFGIHIDDDGAAP